MGHPTLIHFATHKILKILAPFMVHISKNTLYISVMQIWKERNKTPSFERWFSIRWKHICDKIFGRNYSEKWKPRDSRERFTIKAMYSPNSRHLIWKSQQRLLKKDTDSDTLADAVSALEMSLKIEQLKGKLLSPES